MLRRTISLTLAGLAALSGCHLNLNRSLAPGELRGRVVLADGTTPAAGASVQLADSTLALTADAQGTFAFTGLSSGQYGLAFAYDPGATGHPSAALGLTHVELSSGDGLDLGTLQLVATGALHGTVLLNGAPAPGATLTVLDASGQAVTGIPTALSDANGHYAIAFAPAGTITVKAVFFQGGSAREGTSLPVNVIAGADSAANIVLQQPATPGIGSVTGRAATIGVTAPSQVAVTLTPTAAWSSLAPITETQLSTTLFAVADIPPGVYDVSISASGLVPVVLHGIVVDGSVDLGTVVFRQADPCLNSHGGCDTHATCAPDEQGSAVCACGTGYVGNGQQCVVAGPCETNNGGCDRHATCTVVGGAPSCTCTGSFVGDGMTCMYAAPAITNLLVTPAIGVQAGAMITASFELNVMLPATGVAVTLSIPAPRAQMIPMTCTPQGLWFSCAYTLTGAELMAGDDLTATVNVTATDSVGAQATDTGSVELDDAGPSVKMVDVQYQPAAGNPLSTPTAATGGTTIVVTITTDRDLGGLPQQLVGISGQGAQLSFRLIGASGTQAVFSTVVAANASTGVYTLSGELTDALGITAPIPGTSSVSIITAAAPLTVTQSNVQWVRSPWGSADAETTAFGTIPAGPYAALTPPDSSGGVSAATFPTGTFSLGTATPAEVLLCSSADCASPLATFTPSQAGWPVQPLTSAAALSAPEVWVAGIDAGGNVSAAVKVQSCQWIATPSQGGLSATPFATPSLMQDPLVTSTQTASFGLAETPVTSTGAMVWRIRNPSGSPPAVTNHAVTYDAVRGVLVMHGGLDSTGHVTSHTFEWNGESWSDVTPTSSGPAIAHHPMTYDAARGRTLLAASNATWEWNGTAWTEVTPMSPPSTQDAGLAFDGVTGSVVLFGGTDGTTTYGDTWTWNGSAWTKALPAGSATPPARTSPAMTYDVSRGVIVLFGGQGASGNLLNDLWEWNGSSWTNVTAATAGPSARAGASLVYDAARRVTVLVGGGFVDAWTWNGTRWVEVTPVQNPPPSVTGAKAAYDAVLGMTVLTGSAQAWGFDGTLGIDLTPTGQLPSARTGHAIDFDPQRGETVLFGGSATSDTWLWNGFRWREASPPTTPPARSQTGMTYDALAGESLVFGGTVSGGQVAGDTWGYDGFNWYPLATTAPSARQSPVMAFDAQRQVTVLFGGFDATGTPLQDVWEYSFLANGWTQSTPSASPLPAGLQATGMTFSPADQQVIVYGGRDASGASSPAVWLWNGTQWTEVSIATPEQGGPAARANPLMVTDSLRQVAMIVGGQSPTTMQPLGDVWEWNGATMNQRTVASPQTPYLASAGAFDSRRGRLVVFGGSDSSGSAANETWELDTPPSRTPALEFDAMLSQGNVPVAAVTGLTVRAACGGSSPSGNGAQLLGWDTAQAGWSVLQSGSSASATPPLVWSADRPQEFVLQKDGRAAFQCRPSGPSGATEAQVAASYFEVRVAYAAP